jgi:hypothetical protein
MGSPRELSVRWRISPIAISILFLRGGFRSNLRGPRLQFRRFTIALRFVQEIGVVHQTGPQPWIIRIELFLEDPHRFLKQRFRLRVISPRFVEVS